MELGGKTDRGSQWALNPAGKDRVSSYLCSPGLIKVWFWDHVHHYQLQVFGKMQIPGPSTKQIEFESLGVGLKQNKTKKKLYILNKLFS